MRKKELSVIVPVRNEEGNIYSLTKRIAQALDGEGITYEILYVDDHSTDNTRSQIASLSNTYPIKLVDYEGKPGKAYALMHGFTQATYSTIAMIDGDLQYPPEALPGMLEKLVNKKADIVVANRIEANTPLVRRVVSRGFHLFFTRFLHKIDCDTQSGLKVFRKEILSRFSLNPAPWAFDLEFLIKAQNAGYKIDTVNIVFEKRQSGNSKLRVMNGSYQIGKSALALWIKPHEIVPFTPKMAKKEGEGFHYKGQKFVHHTTLDVSESALHRVTPKQVIFLLCIALALIIDLIINWHATIVLLIAVLTALYFIDLLFNLFLIYRSFSKTPEVQITDEEIEKVQESAWPSYTIFCPLYKESNVLPQFVTAMSQLEYPKDKLQVMLLLEEDDAETIKAAQDCNLPQYFDIVIVPHSQPKTKPKACNYGLTKARGEYVVIYDAEDIPDPKQLKKAVIAFEKSGPKVKCVQAKLNFYNTHQNILTRVFTAEYSLWFDLVLTGLQSINAPIPLGGTSNHFKTQDLRSLQGWDAFNVTEDCDLGMRIAKKGFQTCIVDSVTLEEANSNIFNWFRQRTRWIKGYIQTYLVHMRRPGEFMRDFKTPLFPAFQLIVGGKVMSMFINPLMWMITISYFAFRPFIGKFIESFYPTPVLYMAVFSLIFGNFLYLYYYMIGCAKRGDDDLVKYVFFVPVYWLGMSISAFRAASEMLYKPHFWAKTVHGLHLNNEKSKDQAEMLIGRGLVDEGISNAHITVSAVYADIGDIHH